MSTSAESTSPIGPLSVGNVVTAAVRIYRSHLQQYFMLALRAYLWIFVPVYGWAKYAAISGLISRLAFQELINQPETVQEARKQVNPRMWQFLVTGILIFLRFFGLYIGAALTLGVVSGILGVFTVANPAIGLFNALAAFVLIVTFIIGAIRFYSRLIITEVPLSIEPGLTASKTINRSWVLTKGAVGRIQWIVVVAFLISLLIYAPVQIISSLLQSAISADPSSGAANFFLLLMTALSLLSGALVNPFWQVIKAVIYYDLRSRREGLGLELRRRNPL